VPAKSSLDHDKHQEKILLQNLYLPVPFKEL